MFPKKPQLQLDLDRAILPLTGNNHKDDQIVLRDIFEHIFITGSTGSGKTSTVGYYLIQKLLNVQNLREQDKIGMIVFLYKSGDIDHWLKWVEQQNRTDDQGVYAATIFSGGTGGVFRQNSASRLQRDR